MILFKNLVFIITVLFFNSIAYSQVACKSSYDCETGKECTQGFCTGGENLPVGSICTHSYQCAGSLQCTATSSLPVGTCIDYTSDSNLSAGSLCSASWQCSGDLLCKGGVCVDYEREEYVGRGGVCSASWQCSGSLRCYGNENGQPGRCDD